MLHNGKLFGLFSNSSNLIQLARSTREEINETMKRCNFDTIGLVEMIKLFDGMSNKMCGVSDPADCIRRLHPEKSWKYSSERAYDVSVELMNELNLNEKLYTRFMTLLSAPNRLIHDFETEAAITAFQRDFEMIHLKKYSQLEKDKIKGLQREISMVEVEFERLAGIKKGSLLVEKLIRLRFDLARLVGRENPSQIILADKELKSSDEVMKFLKNTWLDTENPCCFTRSSPDANVSLTTTVPMIIQTLSTICETLFDVEVVFDLQNYTDFNGKISPKVDIYEKNELIGTVYFTFSDKKSSPVHYTIQCRISDLQPAIVVISVPTKSPEKEEAVWWSEGQSIFHEFGHAIHAILSDTKYQMLSGTRGAVDISEIPSTLLELFYESDQIQETLFTNTCDNKKNVKPSAIMNMNEKYQIQISALDQLLHTEPPGKDGWTKDLLELVHSDFPIKNSNKKNWLDTVGHIATYGGAYYSYLYSERSAQRIWQNVFQRNPFNRSAGLLFKNDFLIKGALASSQKLSS